MYFYRTMAGSELLDMLQTLERSVRKLKQRNERLESENAELKQSVFEYLAKLEHQMQENDSLRGQIRSKDIAGKLDSNSKDLAKEIDQYIRLIDKCLAAIHTKI